MFTRVFANRRVDVSGQRSARRRAQNRGVDESNSGAASVGYAPSSRTSTIKVTATYVSASSSSSWRTVDARGVASKTTRTMPRPSALFHSRARERGRRRGARCVDEEIVVEGVVVAVHRAQGVELVDERGVDRRVGRHARGGQCRNELTFNAITLYIYKNIYYVIIGHTKCIELSFKRNKIILFRCVDDPSEGPFDVRATRSRARPRVSRARPRVDRREPFASRVCIRARVPHASAARRRRPFPITAAGPKDFHHGDDDARARAPARATLERRSTRENETVRRRSRARRRARWGRARALEGGFETFERSRRRSAPGRGRERAKRSVYVETYGCQMNVNDSEVMMSVLESAGYDETKEVNEADVIFGEDRRARYDKAEAKIWQRLAYFRSLGNGKKRSERPVVGVLGCMAERIKEKLLEADRLADIVAGPGVQRICPISSALVVDRSEKAMNVQLSVEETYADIIPVREAGSHSAFVTIMRGCDNACAFCIVRAARWGRSRDLASIMYEIRLLSEQGVKEVTLLGQNVSSYAGSPASETTTDF